MSKVARDKLIVANMLQNLLQENLVHLVLWLLRGAWSVFNEFMHDFSNGEVFVNEHVEEPEGDVTVVYETAGVLALEYKV